MTTDTTLNAADAVFEAEQAVSRACWVVEELQETVASALRVLDDAELDSAKAKLSERSSFYLEAAGEVENHWGFTIGHELAHVDPGKVLEQAVDRGIRFVISFSVTVMP